MKVAQDLFNRIDVDNTGLITKDQLRKFTIYVMTGVKKGYKFDEAEFEQGFALLDPDGDGALDLKDFIVMVESSFKSLGAIKRP